MFCKIKQNILTKLLLKSHSKKTNLNVIREIKDKREILTVLGEELHKLPCNEKGQHLRSFNEWNLQCTSSSLHHWHTSHRSLHSVHISDESHPLRNGKPKVQVGSFVQILTFSVDNTGLCVSRTSCDGSKIFWWWAAILWSPTLITLQGFILIFFLSVGSWYKQDPVELKMFLTVLKLSWIDLQSNLPKYPRVSLHFLNEFNSCSMLFTWVLKTGDQSLVKTLWPQLMTGYLQECWHTIWIFNGDSATNKLDMTSNPINRSRSRTIKTNSLILIAKSRLAFQYTFPLNIPLIIYCKAQEKL